jgi:hypothetical protein
MHSSSGPAGGGLDPPESFVGKIVEGGHGYGEVFFSNERWKRSYRCPVPVHSLFGTFAKSSAGST